MVETEGVAPGVFVPRSGKPRSMEDVGRAAWTALHSAAKRKAITPFWLDHIFLGMIPRRCDCLPDWHQVLLLIPFRATDQFAWSVEVHNAVNVKLGKPVLSLEQAVNSLK
jgi:hypothetical protein